MRIAIGLMEDCEGGEQGNLIERCWKVSMDRHIDKWIVQDAAYADCAVAILEFLLEEYERLFGHDIMYNEECIVYNDTTARCPMLVRDQAPVRIRLAQKSYEYWGQTIYQLSHEMCHYAMRQSKTNKEFTLSWFEEIVCEAMSLYALEYAAKHWERCELSKRNPSYCDSIGEYLEGELGKKTTDEFRRCDTIEKLLEYEEQSFAEDRRESHCAERNLIYRAISSNPNEVKCVLGYSHYVMSNKVLIDFDRWTRDGSCDLLLKLQSVQPVSVRG